MNQGLVDSNIGANRWGTLARWNVNPHRGGEKERP